MALFVGVFSGTISAMPAQEIYKPEFQGSQVFFLSESKYSVLGPLFYTGSSQMAAAKGTCGKASSCSSGKTAVCIAFRLLHGRFKRENVLF